jgi:hypothetical protein
VQSSTVSNVTDYTHPVTDPLDLGSYNAHSGSVVSLQVTLYDGFRYSYEDSGQILVAGLGSISGVNWLDLNNDGQVDFGEQGIDGTRILLSGTDNSGHSVSRSTLTTGGGGYVFRDLIPGNYNVSEVQPGGYADGRETPGSNGGSVGSDAFSGIVVGASGYPSDAINYNFGERPQAGAAVTAAQTAGIGFWQNRNGQNLITALPVFGNADGSVTSVGNWLAATLPNLFGGLAGADNFAVAAEFTRRFKLTGIKIDAQLMATALNVYVTTQGLAGSTASSYGFAVSAAGLGNSTWSVGSAGAAFGVANNTRLTVLDLLLRADSMYGSWTTTSLRSAANNVFDGINSY